MRGNRHYVHLVIMIALSFISMYVLMYAMVNRFANVYSNLNQFCRTDDSSNCRHRARVDAISV
jgi:hypothetical protein